MENLTEFLKTTPKRWYTRRISEQHQSFLATLFPSYPLNHQIYFYSKGYTQEPLCKICNGPLKKTNAVTCSLKCRELLHKENNTHVASKKKAKLTCLERYGVDNIAKLPSTQEKRVETNIKKYGSKVSDKCRDSAKQRAGQLNLKGRATLKLNHGVDNPSQLANHRAKCQATLIKNYGVDKYHKSVEYQQQVSVRKYNKWDELTGSNIVINIVESVQINGYADPNDRINFTCVLCNNDETLPTETVKWRVKHFGTPCRQCCNLEHGSNAESTIADFVEQYVSIIRNSRSVIAPKELDIYIPEKNIAIEYNGLFWHNALRISNSYHYDKMQLCLEKDIQLIQIFEDEWLHYKPIVESNIRVLLNEFLQEIDITQCSVTEIDQITVDNFLNSNNINGSDTSTVRIGLYFNDQLVAVMTLLQKDEVWTLSRYCIQLDTKIVGAEHLLFNYFVQKYKPTKIAAFDDRRWNLMSFVYKSLGFILRGTTDPICWYFTLKDRTRYQIASSEDCLQIWDCGNTQWIWNN